MLLQGPNLTNQIVGVLSMFREEQIALIGDIESMFYQMRVPVEQQDMLRFIWRPEGNLDAEPEDYVMCVHLFGGTHSPSTCNHAFRITAIDNEIQFGKEAASAPVKNFYVDDLFKGGPEVDETVTTYRETKGIMCYWRIQSHPVHEQFKRGFGKNPRELQQWRYVPSDDNNQMMAREDNQSTTLLRTNVGLKD